MSECPAVYNGAMSRVLSAIITEEDGGFVSLNPDTGVASQGDTVDSALANLREALELYFEVAEASADAISDSSHPAFLTTITL
jgi:predicted RNase H-like HicB family nuclease